MARHPIRRAICALVGHNDKPLASRINDSPWSLHGVNCQRCYRTDLLPLPGMQGPR